MDHEHVAAERSRFKEWVDGHQGLWTHLHVSCLALRLGAEWVALKMRVVLTDRPRCQPPAGAPLVSTNDVLAIRVSLGIEKLGDLLDASEKGVLTPGVLPGVDRIIHTSCPPGTPPSQSRYSESLEPAVPTDAPDEEEMRCWPHARLELPSTYLASWGERQPWFGKLEGIDRRFRSEGFGSLAGLGRRIRAGHFNNESIPNLVSETVETIFFAPLMVRLRGVHHDRESRKVTADVEMSPGIRRHDVRVAVVSNDVRTWIKPKRVLGTKRRKSMMVARGLPIGTATVYLTYEPIGEVGKMGLVIEPPPRPWALLAALRDVDPELGLLREGLVATAPQVHGKHDHGAEFERAIHVLLSACGYSGVWWGRGGKLRSPGNIQAGAEADLLMFSKERNELLIVECTTTATGGDKVHKLVGRSLRVGDAVRCAFEKDTPNVRAVFAFSVPRSQVPPAARGALRDNGAGLLAKEDALELLDMLEKGRTANEISERIDRLFDDDIPRSPVRARRTRRAR
jgi:hypothetical protein